MATCATQATAPIPPRARPRGSLLGPAHAHEGLRKMTKEEAIALQAAVDEILALAVEKRSEIGGAVASPVAGADARSTNSG
jgi:hypothetical protein